MLNQFIGILIFCASASNLFATDLERLKFASPETLSFDEIREVISHPEIHSSRQIQVLEHAVPVRRSRFDWNQKQMLLELAIGVKTKIVSHHTEPSVSERAVRIWIQYDYSFNDLLDHDSASVRRGAIENIPKKSIRQDRDLAEKLKGLILSETDEDVLGAILDREADFGRKALSSNFESILPRVKSHLLVAGIIDLVSRGTEVGDETFRIAYEHIQSRRYTAATHAALSLYIKFAFLQKKTSVDEHVLRQIPKLDREGESLSSKHMGANEYYTDGLERTFAQIIYYGLQGPYRDAIKAALFDKNTVSSSTEEGLVSIMTSENFPQLPLTAKTLTFWSVIRDVVDEGKTVEIPAVELLEHVNHEDLMAGASLPSSQAVSEVSIRLMKLYLERYYDLSNRDTVTLKTFHTNIQSQRPVALVFADVVDDMEKRRRGERKCGGGRGPFSADFE